MFRSITVICASALFGFLCGAIMALLTRQLYIPILAPVAMGVAVGAALGFCVHYFRVSGRSVVIAAAVIGWISCMSAFHWVEYRAGFIRAVATGHDLMRAADSAPALTQDQAVEAADVVLEQLVGYRGFGGFLRLRVYGGLRFRGFGESTLGPAWVIGVWLTDLILVLVLTLKIALAVRKQLPV